LSLEHFPSFVSGIFPHLCLLLLGIGLFFTAWFFVYEVAQLNCDKNRGFASVVDNFFRATAASTLFVSIVRVYMSLSPSLPPPTLPEGLEGKKM
jgi:uncharacterized membrane protein